MSSAERVLTLFLSNGGSLVRWEQQAILSREILLYLHLTQRGVFDRVQIFSYDGRDRDLLTRLAQADPGFSAISLLAPARGSFDGPLALLWGLYGVVRNFRQLRTSSVIKTNQVSGSWTAIFASVLSRRPLVFRLGYVLSWRFERNGQSVRAQLAKLLEIFAIHRSSRVLASSRAVGDAMASRYPAMAGKVMVTPTYVDLGTFAAKFDYRFDEPLIWVGRMSEVKNLRNLLRACALTGRDLVLVGGGELEPELKQLASELPVSVIFAGLVPNEMLAAKLREHSIFILPSFLENLPKALIEAMASGLICIASSFPGIGDLISDGENGYLIEGFEPDDIAEAITRVLRDQNPEVGRRARLTVKETFSLESYVDREARVYASILRDGQD